MSRLAPLVAALAAVAGLVAGTPARAQGGTSPKHTTASLQRLAAQKSRDLARASADVERWMDLLIRYHLGVPVEVDKACALSELEGARPRGELERELADRLEAVARSSAELERLSGELRHLEQAVREQPPPSARHGAPPAGIEPVAAATAEPPPAATPRHAEQATEERPPAGPAPGAPLGLIRGSVEPSHLGLAFFMAGQFAKARDQLEKVAAREDAPLSSLFYLARSYEKLGDVARADSAFLRVEALDDARGAGGRWASAARTARQHMNWTRDHGSWHPPEIPKGPPR